MQQVFCSRRTPLLLLLLLQGNMGGGWALLLMPLVCNAIVNSMGLPAFVAWRWCFMVPGCLQVGPSIQQVSQFCN
jgi:hypothetical protein